MSNTSKSNVISSTSQYDLPFFDAAHADLARGLADWAPQQQVDESDDRRACKEWVKRLGQGGWLRYCVPAGDGGALGGALPQLDSRALVILRETLAFHSPLADFALPCRAWAVARSLWQAHLHSKPPTCQRWRGATRSPRLP